MADDQDTTPPAPPPDEPAKPAAAPLGDAIKAAFGRYLADQGIQPPPGQDLQVDLEFLKQHAGPLIVHMLRGATQSLLPRELKVAIQAPRPEAPPAGEAGAAPAPGTDAATDRPAATNITFDLGDLLARLLNPPPRT
ncbi:MAG: hypothetical protein IT385_12945 [Deltaproteobacteria bacterium]|nr:hypothetical protein [Deltaproteobacteria bacterium]